MALYDPNINNQYKPWYAPQTQSNPYTVQSTTTPAIVPASNQQNPINQFVWVTNEGMVDMWPVAAGSEMTFINNEEMILYVKRVDEYNHPLKLRKFKLTEILDEPQPANNQINAEELKNYISDEVKKAVSEKLSSFFESSNKEG